ncbi:conserved hypothetical protein [Ricinus communis]|uniref:Uncharacterized protein n=1 Tax=Ricinus communis TaxID=3988 RepID=B9RHC1_RICCO|nr:conserved hypothetical protein [Ricinus communis]
MVELAFCLSQTILNAVAGTSYYQTSIKNGSAIRALEKQVNEQNSATNQKFDELLKMMQTLKENMSIAS